MLVELHQISMHRDFSCAITTDPKGHELQVNDNVREVDGGVCPLLPPLFHPPMCITGL
jgi:hypothetical protein